MTCKQKKTLYKPRGLCRLCFTKVVEKNFRKALFRKLGREVILVNDGSAAGVALEYLMKNSLNNPIKLTVRKSIPAKTNKTVLIPTTLDEEVACFLDEFLGKKIKKTKYLKPLRNMLDEECVTYAKLKKLKFKKTKKQTKATKFLDKLEKISPGSRFALLRSMDKIHSN